MTIFQSIILGIVQGLTEFLPVSSSAHLVIIPNLFGWEIPPGQAFVFNVLVQVATLVAVVAFFWKDLISILKAMLDGLIHKKPLEDTQSRLGWLILLATIPAGLLGLALKGIVEKAFASLVATGFFMIVTSILLVAAERLGKRNRNLEGLAWKDAVWIGCFQAAAIFPGLSRSGSTITGGMMRDLDRRSAARFSFLMSIPILSAAGLLETIDLLQMPNLSQNLLIFIPGFIAAGVVGYLSIRWLLRYLVNHTFYDFAIYCAVVGLVTLIAGLINS